MSLNFNKGPEFVTRIVMGVTRFNGEVEGQHIDSCNVLIVTSLDVASGNALGLGVAKVRFGDSSNFHRFVGLTFPCELDLLFTRVTNAGSKSKEVLFDFKVPGSKA